MYDTSDLSQNEDLLNRIVDKLKPQLSSLDKYPDPNGIYSTLCPFHGGKQNGFFFFNKSEYNCTFCGVHGNIDQLAEELGIGEKNIIEINGKGGVTRASYAEAHDFSNDYLKSLQISDRNFNNTPRLIIPYFDSSGNIPAVRYQFSLQGTPQYSWKKGSHVIPYGIWKQKELLQSCKTKWGYSNIIFLVPNESDTQTLWLYDFPALGIPNGDIWKTDWKKFTDNCSVYFLQNSDNQDQTINRIAKDIPEIYVAKLPANRNSINDCHIHGDDVTELIKKFIKEAIPHKEILQKRNAEESKQLFQASESIIQNDVLNEVTRFCSENFIVGEDSNIKLTYLVLTSRVLARPISLAIKGPSSSGKSYILEVVLKLFPESAYYALSSMSEKALIYSEESFIHRFLIIFEASGCNSDFLSYVIRSLLSEGCIRYITVETTDNGIKPRVITQEGPTGFITTTTAHRLHPENETRMFSIDIKDDSKQTKNILYEIAEIAQGINRITRSPAEFIAFQTWIEKYGCHDVVIPFAKELAELTHTNAVRMRRDFTAVINLIKTVAILYQNKREKDDNGRIIAIISDYKVVYDLVSEIINEGVEKSVSHAIRETVEAVKRLLPDSSNDDFEDDDENPKKSKKPEYVDLPSIAEELHLDRSSISRRVYKAIDLEFLVNLETRKGQRAKIVLGRPMPEDRSVLPTPEQLKNKLESFS